MIGAAGHGWGIAVFPLAATVIAAIFGATLLGRFTRRRRPYEAVWGVALFMFAAASLAAVLGVGGGWTTTVYRVFWLFGVVLNVLFLAQGELYLLSRRRRIMDLLLLALVIVSGLSTWIVWTSSVHAGALADALPRGSEAWGTDSAAYQLRWASWIGLAILLGGIVWSARRLRGRPELRDRAAGTMWIGMGVLVNAAGGGIGAATQVVPLFSISLALGIAMMFWGFVRAGRPAAL
jgi:hypothetical protein